MTNPANYLESPFATRRIQTLFDTPEMRVVEALFFVPPILACCCGTWAFGYHTMLLVVLLPMLLCRLITTLFNVEYHPANPNETQCKSVDNARFLARIVGESKHESHHTYPRRAYRRDWDLPYWILLRPLELAGGIWNCQA
jgi:fatty-acid desaturase